MCKVKEVELNREHLINRIETYLNQLLKEDFANRTACVEIRNCWNSFLVLEANECYGQQIVKSPFVQTFHTVLSDPSSCDASIEDLCYITENALVSEEFRNAVLKNKEFVSAITVFFDVSYQKGEMEILRHLVVLLRNLFFDLDFDDQRKWVVYEHAHLVVKTSSIPEQLQQLILESSNKALKLFAMELGSYNFIDLDDEQNRDVLEEVCTEMIDWLILALDSSNQTITIPDTEYNTSSYNLVALLARVAYNDRVKIVCAKKGLLEKLLKFIQNPMAPKILSEVLTIFDQICFVEYEVELSRDSLKVLKQLAMFLTGETEDVAEEYYWIKSHNLQNEVKKPAKSLLQGISMAEPIVPKVEAQVMISESCQTEPQAYIMLSYNWESKDVVKFLVTTIRESGFQVWVDDEKMLEYGDINDGMADAVENCKLMVAVVSEKYKLSKNCRRELEYADNRNKPFVIVKKEGSYEPNGWLGLMMGKKLYHCLDAENLQQSCESVVDAIKTNLDKKASPRLADKGNPKNTPLGVGDSSGLRTTAQVMEHDQYKKWVKRNPAVKFLRKDSKNKKIFNEFVIAALVDQIYSESQSEVVEKLKKDFNLNASDAMTLVKVLQTRYI